MNDLLMDEIERQIDMHPETHRQNYWATQTECGTAYCVAGWACILSGYEFRWLGDTGLGLGVYPSGEPWNWDGAGEVAQDLLGLTNNQADWLFAGSNSREDISRIRKRISNGEIA